MESTEDYKKFIINSPIKNKLCVLTMHLPRFLWIIRDYEDDKPIGDGIYDGTSVYVKKLASSEFFDKST